MTDYNFWQLHGPLIIACFTIALIGSIIALISHGAGKARLKQAFYVATQFNQHTRDYRKNPASIKEYQNKIDSHLTNATSYFNVSRNTTSLSILFIGFFATRPFFSFLGFTNGAGLLASLIFAIMLTAGVTAFLAKEFNHRNKESQEKTELNIPSSSN